MSESKKKIIIGNYNVNDIYENMKRVTGQWLYLETKEEYEKAFTDLAANFTWLDEVLSEGKDLPDAWKRSE